MTSIEHESDRPVKDSQDSVRSREFSDKRLEGASIVRALDLPESSEIVFLNWRPGAAGQILEKTFRSYRFFPTIKEMLASSSHDGMLIHSNLSMQGGNNDPIRNDSKEEERFVIFVDLAFDSITDKKIFLEEIMPSVLGEGGLVIARQDWGKQSDLANNKELKAQNIDKPIQIERVLAFPSIEDPDFLFREDFLNEKEDAWRAIAEFLDETGRSREPGSSPIPELWERFRIGNQFPTQCVPCFSVFYNTGDFSYSPVNIDFLKISTGERKAQFWIETKKPRGQDEIIRRALYPASTALDFIETESPPNFRHTLSVEPFRSGTTLAALWLTALAPGAPPDQLRAYFVDYYSFLKKSIRDSGFCDFDLIPDNLLLNSDGTISPIDQEWAVSHPSFTSEVAFCRGVGYFLFRFARRLDMIDLSRQFGPCHRDFLCAATEWVGIDICESLKSFYSVEQQFREFSLERYAVLDPESLLNRQFGDLNTAHLKLLRVEMAEMSLGTRSPSQVNTLTVPANSGRKGVSINISTFCTGAGGYALFIFFPKKFGKPRFESLRVYSVTLSSRTNILNSIGHEKVIGNFESLTNEEQNLLREHDEFGVKSSFLRSGY